MYFTWSNNHNTETILLSKVASNTSIVLQIANVSAEKHGYYKCIMNDTGQPDTLDYIKVGCK